MDEKSDLHTLSKSSNDSNQDSVNKFLQLLARYCIEKN